MRIVQFETLLYLGPSVSTDDNCTSHCNSRNLTCSTEFTELDVKSINCNKSAKSEWNKMYHPSYNEQSHTCEGFKKTKTERACDKVNSPSNVSRICLCLRPGKEFLQRETRALFIFLCPISFPINPPNLMNRL